MYLHKPFIPHEIDFECRYFFLRFFSSFKLLLCFSDFLFTERNSKTFYTSTSIKLYYILVVGISMQKSTCHPDYYAPSSIDNFAILTMFHSLVLYNIIHPSTQIYTINFFFKRFSCLTCKLCRTSIYMYLGITSERVHSQRSVEMGDMIFNVKFIHQKREKKKLNEFA